MTGLLKKIFLNFQYKVSAVFIATIFWYIVQGEEILEINRKIEVNLQVPEGYLIKGSRIRIKDATLRGSRVLLGDFSSRPIEANIEIPKGKSGQLRFRIDKEYIANWNPKIRLTVHDAYIAVFVDQKMAKSLPVKEQIQGIPADGYFIEKITLMPSKVEVAGLKSEISRLRQILTEPVDLNGLQKSRTFDVALMHQDFQPAELSSEQVRVSVRVGEKKINKRFGSILVEAEGAKYQARVRPGYVSIVIQGTPEILSFIKRGDLRAFLDTSMLAPGHYEKKIQVKIPPDTVLIETFPEYAMVEIEEAEKKKTSAK